MAGWRTAVRRTNGRGRAFTWRFRAQSPCLRRRGRRSHRRDRQPQWVPTCDAGGTVSDAAHARVVTVPEPPRRNDVSHGCPARVCGRHESSTRHHLPRRYSHLAAYFEAAGRVRRAISVVKKRTGSHEDTIREFQISDRGITIGPPLEEFQGVLRGVPTYIGDAIH